MSEPSSGFTHYLLAYFDTEESEDGEQIRFAVSETATPDRWIPLRESAPILTSTVGERGVRDPFLIRDHDGGFHLLATDLRTWPEHDWNRAVRTGSQSIVVFDSDDLIHWSPPRLAHISPPGAGNTWAPKAFWSTAKNAWVVFWASALYEDDDDRRSGSHQRILAADTTDFRSFTAPRVHVDAGHDVIDMTFIDNGDSWYRFSANAHPLPNHDATHIFMEKGPQLESVDFQPVAIDVGRDAMVRGEGPAPIPALDGEGWYLLIDEFGLRGYQLLKTRELDHGTWSHVPDATLPPGARHGSVMPITREERARILTAAGAAESPSREHADEQADTDRSWGT